MRNTRSWNRIICIFFSLIMLVAGICSVSCGMGSDSVCPKNEKSTGTMVSVHSQVSTRQSLLMVDENTGIKSADGIVIQASKNSQVRVPAKSFLFLFLFVYMAGSVCIVSDRTELLQAGYTNSSNEIIHYLHEKDGLKG